MMGGTDTRVTDCWSKIMEPMPDRRLAEVMDAVAELASCRACHSHDRCAKQQRVAHDAASSRQRPSPRPRWAGRAPLRLVHVLSCPGGSAKFCAAALAPQPVKYKTQSACRLHRCGYESPHLISFSLLNARCRPTSLLWALPGPTRFLVAAASPAALPASPEASPAAARRLLRRTAAAASTARSTSSRPPVREGPSAGARLATVSCARHVCQHQWMPPANKDSCSRGELMQSERAVCRKNRQAVALGLAFGAGTA